MKTKISTFSVNSSSAMIIKMAVVFFVLFSFLIALTLHAWAYDAPRIYVEELNIENPSYNSGEIINGSFVLWNSSENIADLDYSISLNMGSKIFGEEIYSVSEQINPDQKLLQNFSYNIQKNIEGGSYFLRIRIYNKNGVAANWKDSNVVVYSENPHLKILNNYVMRGEEYLDPGIGIIFNSGNSPKIRFNAFNPAKENIKFVSRITTYKYQFNKEKIEEFSANEESLNSRERKEIEIDLPKYEESGSYLARVVLESDGKVFSNVASFRWVVEGDGATILDIKTKEDFFQKGKEIEITVDFVGPADASNIGRGMLIVDIYTEKGKLMATKSKEVELNDDVRSEKANFVLSADVPNPVVKSRILKNEKELDASVIKIKSPGEKISSSSADTDYSYAIVFLFLLILVIIILVANRIIFKNKNLHIVIFLISAGILFSNITVKAAVTINLNSPVANSVYNPSEIMLYDGNIIIPGCNNRIIDSEITTSLCDINHKNCFNYKKANKNNSVDPTDLFYDSVEKRYYVADPERNRIVKIEITGGSIIIDETFFNSADSFNYPNGVFYDSSSGYIYVADLKNNRVVRFKRGAIPGSVADWETFVGYGGDRFKEPKDVFYDSSSGYIYVADSTNNRIVRFKRGATPGSVVNWEVFKGSGKYAISSPKKISYDPVSKSIYTTSSSYKVVGFKTESGLGGEDWRVYDFFEEGVYSLVYHSGLLYVGEIDGGGSNDQITYFNPGLCDCIPPKTTIPFYSDQFRVSTIFPEISDFPSEFAFGDKDKNKLYAEVEILSYDVWGNASGKDRTYVPIYVNISSLNVSPVISIYEPDGMGDVIPPDNPYDVIYYLNDSDDVVTAKFYYDNDNKDLNGTAIAGLCSNAPEGIGVGCTWNTIGVPPGAYYIYGIASDGVNPPVSTYSGGMLIINPVVINTSPTVSTTPDSPIDYCKTNGLENMKLMWNFIDSEDVNQTAFEMRLNRREDGSACNIAKQGSVAIPDTRLTLSLAEVNSFCPSFIDYGNYTYDWEIKVYDSKDADSGFVSGNPFPGSGVAGIPEPTPDHRYPVANFSYLPTPPPEILQFQNITFDPLSPPESSICYDDNNSLSDCFSFRWEWDDGTPDKTTVPLAPNAIHSYMDSGLYTVDLMVTDSSPQSYSCWASERNNQKDVQVKISDPTWNETIPD